jgi:hypothetical protein
MQILWWNLCDGKHGMNTNQQPVRLQLPAVPTQCTFYTSLFTGVCGTTEPPVPSKCCHYNATYRNCTWANC